MREEDMNILKIIMLLIYKLLFVQDSVGVRECHSMEMQKSEDFFPRSVSPKYWLRSLSSASNEFTHRDTSASLMFPVIYFDKIF